MKKFEFSLQKILNFREFTRKECEIELGRANQEVARIQSELENVAGEFVKTRQSCDASSDPFQMVSASQYYSYLNKKKEKLLEDLTSAQLVAEEKKAAFIEAMQKQKALEKLKETKFEKWNEERKKEEQAIIDDIVIAKYN